MFQEVLQSDIAQNIRQVGEMSVGEVLYGAQNIVITPIPRTNPPLGRTPGGQTVFLSDSRVETLPLPNGKIKVKTFQIKTR